MTSIHRDSEKRPGPAEFPDRLQLLDAMPRNGIVAEIGVQRGDFAAEILRRCEPELLILVDSWQHFGDGPYCLDKSNVTQEEHELFYIEVCERFRRELEAGRVLILRGLSRSVIPMLPNGVLDWLYLDANHTYDEVYSDLVLCHAKVKQGGLIAGHDYVEAPEQAFGVIRAVDDFCRAFKWELFARTRDDHLCSGFDSFVLRRVAEGIPNSIV